MIYPSFSHGGICLMLGNEIEKGERLLYSEQSIANICRQLKIDPKSIERKSLLWF